MSGEFWWTLVLSVPVGIGTGLAVPPLQRWYKHRHKTRQIRHLEDQRDEYYETLVFLRNPEKFSQFLILCAMRLIIAAFFALCGLQFFAIAAPEVRQARQEFHIVQGIGVFRAKPALLVFALAGPVFSTLGIGLLSSVFRLVRAQTKRVDNFDSYAETLPPEVRNKGIEQMVKDEIKHRLPNTR